jgi:uncharacterized protein
MKSIFVDSNVFLRFFTISNDVQHRQAVELLRKAASGNISLITGPPVLFEIAWTMRTAYSQSREVVLDIISSIAATPGLELIDAEVVEEAITLARRSDQEFADAYIVAIAQKAGAAEIATFNKKHFEKLEAKLHKF